MEQSLKNKAYDFIKEKIFTCEFMPGDFLDEKYLIQEIGASRTPIREALNKIEQENLIQIVPKKGIFVKHITAKNVIDIFQVRETIEPNGLYYYGEKLDKHQIICFRNRFLQPEDDPKINYKLDDDFHTYLTTCFNNEYITKIMDDMYGLNNRIRVLTGQLDDCVSHSQNEHIEIIDYILDDDYKNASDALRKHLQLSKERTLSLFLVTG